MIHSYAIFDVDKASKGGRVYTKKLLTKLRKSIKQSVKDGKPFFAVVEDTPSKLMATVDLKKVVGEITDARISKGEFIIDITIDYDKPYPFGEMFEKTIRDLNPLEYGFSPIGYGTSDENGNVNDDYTFICANFILKNPLQK